MKSNYLIIPDIHGQIEQYRAMEKLIKEELKKDIDLHVVFLGDYVDRGVGQNYRHYSKKFQKEVELYFEDIGSRLVVEKLFELREYFEKYGAKCTFLRGNHEDTFIQHVKDIEKGNNLIANLESRMTKLNRRTIQEYIATLKGFTYDVELMKKTKRLFESFEYYLYDEINNLFFVHAGVEPDVVLRNNTPATYTWIREKFFMHKGIYPAKVIFGHTPIDSLTDEEKSFLNVNEPENIILKEDRIGLDSGNYRKHPLNVLRIKNDEYQLIKIDAQGAIQVPIILSHQDKYLEGILKI